LSSVDFCASFCAETDLIFDSLDWAHRTCERRGEQGGLGVIRG